MPPYEIDRRWAGEPVREAAGLWAKYVAVALTAASPIGEELVSIPLGVGLGLDPALVAVVSVVFNMLPALVISALFRRTEQGTGMLRVMLRMDPEPVRSAVRWILRRRSQRLLRALDRWGVWGVLIVTPWAGVYGTTLTLEVAGMRRSRLLASIAASLIIHAAIVTVASVGVFSLV